MTLQKAFLTALGSALVFGVLGGVLGWCIGTFAPDAYVGMLRLPPESFSPVQFGIGVGLINGLFTGLGLAILLVGIVSWHDVRTQQISQKKNDSHGAAS
jgi:hypothetical protein